MALGVAVEDACNGVTGVGVLVWRLKTGSGTPTGEEAIEVAGSVE
jgi:hypothetical protein